ncbi:PAS domain-containing protein [Spongiimicrobium salis]|uniref:PAS domain-containing protein n=1 Tax=Spongiimicrobium salis TaxID=1667022 RepID=UPI00374CED56
MKNYETAAHQFYSRQNLKNLPLNSWDLYSTHFDALCAEAKDLHILKDLAKANSWSAPVAFEEALIDRKEVIVVTDAALNIVHATHNMIAMNGYTLKETKGQKPKMFQGALTSKETTQKIAKAIKNEESFETVVLNYRKDGSTYNCWIKGQPLFNDHGKVVNFIAFEREVA